MSTSTYTNDAKPTQLPADAPAAPLLSWLLSQQPLFGLDADGKLAFVSDTLAACLKEKPTDCTGKALLDFFDTDNRTSLTHRMGHAVRNDGLWQGYFRTRNGGTLLQANVYPLPADAPYAYLGLLQEVKQERQPEERELQREQDARLAAVERVMASIEFDLKGNIRNANDNFLNATGYTREEIVGLHHRIFMFPEDAAKIEYDEMWRKLNAGEPLVGIFKRKTKDGKEIWILGSYNPILDADGKPRGLVKYVFDITEQKKLERRLYETFEEMATAEEELRMNMEEIQAINEEIESTRAEMNSHLNAISRSTAMIEFDLKGNIRNANDNFLNATGYTREEIVGLHHRIFMFPEDADKIEYDEMWRKLNAGEPLVGSFKRKTKDGKEIWILGSYNPILDADGKPRGLVKYVFDITEQKKLERRLYETLEEMATAEEELRMNMEEIQAINEEIERTRAEMNSHLNAISRSTAMVEFDLKGNIRNANDNFLNATGYTREEIVGLHHRIFMFPEDADKLEYDEMWRGIGAGEFVSGTFRRRTKDGKEIWILGSYNPIFDSNGKPNHAVKYVIDVTAQVQQERALQQSISAQTAAEEELRMNMEEIQAINEELDMQRTAVEHLLDDVQSSMQYARRIQKAMIPNVQQLNKQLPANYRADVLFRPRDIISGDFYWMGHWNRRTILAVGDGTGHGVPGSFMSLLGMGVLQKLVERSVTDPVVLLEEVDAEIRRVLDQGSVGSLQDSIEMAICTIDERHGTVMMASAMRPVWQVQGTECTEHPASRFPVGGTQHGEKHFHLKVFDLEPGQTLYLFSDGLRDQFGGPDNKKWGRRNLQELILANNHLPIANRLQPTDQAFLQWKGHHEQTDDVLCVALEYQGL